MNAGSKIENDNLERTPTQVPSIKYVTLEGRGGPRRCDSCDRGKGQEHVTYVTLIIFLIQHGLLSKMVYRNAKYVIVTRSYAFFKYTQNLIGNITLLRVIIYVASVN